MLKRNFFLTFLLVAVGMPAVQAQSLLWKITGPDLQAPSYLYGTMHIPDERVYDFTDKFYEAWDNIEVLALELRLDMGTQAKVMQLLQLPEGESLKDHLSKKDYKKIDKVMQEKMGMPLQVYNRFQPIFVWMMLQQANTIKETLELQKQGLQPLDKGLNDAAEHADITVVGLETPESQAKIFTDVPIKKQIETLKSASDEVESGEAEEMMERMTMLYLDGNLEGLMGLFDEDQGLATDMKDQLLTKRNIEMTEGTIELIKAQPTMVAVGAAHLGGDDGLIALLRKEGYQVEPVIGTKLPDRELPGARTPAEDVPENGDSETEGE